MKHHQTQSRPAMIAMIATLALSATPIFAQDTTPTSAAPVAAPAAQAPVATPMAAPLSTTVTSAPVTISAPPPPPAEAAPVAMPAPMATRSTPVMHMPDAPITDAAADPSNPATPAQVRTARAHHAATMKAKPMASAETAPAPVASTAAPVAPPAPATTPAEPAPQPVAQTPAPQPFAPMQVANPSIPQDDMLPIAGLGGVGLLVIAGGAFALSRRRRREEDERLDPAETMAAEPVMAPIAAEAGPVATVPVGAVTREETLPEGFDLSRFGRHVQAAYRGPTPENPSASLRTRLKRAHFFDQQERRAAEAGTAAPMPAAPATAAARSPSPAPAKDRWSDQVVTRPTRPRRTFRPAFQG